MKDKDGATHRKIERASQRLAESSEKEIERDMKGTHTDTLFNGELYHRGPWCLSPIPGPMVTELSMSLC